MKKLNLFIITIATLIFTACSQLSDTKDKDNSIQTGELCKFTLELKSSTNYERALNAVDISNNVEYNITELLFKQGNRTVEPIVEEENEDTSWYLPAGEYDIELKAIATIHDGQGIATELNVYGQRTFTLEMGVVNIIEIPLVIEHSGTGYLELDVSIDKDFFFNYLSLPSYDKFDENGSCIVEPADSGFCVTLKSLATGEIKSLYFLEIWTENIDDSNNKRDFPYDLRLNISNAESIPAGFYELGISSTKYDNDLGKLITAYFVLKDNLVEILDGITNYKPILLPLYKPIVEEETVVLESNSTRFVTYKGTISSNPENNLYSVRVYPKTYNPRTDEFGSNMGSQYDGSTDFCFDTVVGNLIYTQKQSENETIKYYDNQVDYPKNVTLFYKDSPISNYNNIAASNNNLYVRSGDRIYKANLTGNEHDETDYTTVLLNKTNIDGEIDDDDMLSEICINAYDMAAYDDDLFICYFNDETNSYELVNATDIENSEPVHIYTVTENFKQLKDMMFVDNILYFLFTQLETDLQYDFVKDENGNEQQVLNTSLSHPEIKNRAMLYSFKYNPVASTFEQIGAYENVTDSAYYSHYHSTNREDLGLLGPIRFCGIQKTDDTTYIYIADEGVACIGNYNYNGPFSPEEISRVVAVKHTTSRFYSALNIEECFTLDEGQYFESIFNPETYIIQSVRNY